MSTIDSVEFFYLSMPKIIMEGDGSQDALVVRLTAGGHVGWGECEASPLVSIAAFVCPPSHLACQSVSAAVLGQRLDEVADISRIAAVVDHQCMDLLQAAHTWSGIEMAMWDALGRRFDEPVWRLLGYARSHRKQPYASQLLGATPEETLAAGRHARQAGFRAVKFGWGPIGRGTLKQDADQFHAAREGLGPDGVLLIDAGQIWYDDVESAAERIALLEAVDALFLEEPFRAGAFDAYAALARRTSTLKLAGGEAAHNADMAIQLIDYGRIGYIQVDCGRIGGIGPAKRVADHAAARNIQYLNHTFTSHLALSASLQPFAGLENHALCEYPFAPKALAVDLTQSHIGRDADGMVMAPDTPGLGIEVSEEALKRYRVDVEIRVNGVTLYPEAVC